jgi:hypothetical protein
MKNQSQTIGILSQVIEDRRQEGGLFQPEMGAQARSRWDILVASTALKYRLCFPSIDEHILMVPRLAAAVSGTRGR